MDSYEYYREKAKKDRRNIIIVILVILLIVLIPVSMEISSNKKAEKETQRKYADIIEHIEEVGNRTEELKKQSGEAKEKLLRDLEYLE